MAVVVSARSTNPEDANAFVHFVTNTEAAPIWKAKGLDKLK
jgi:ABC-type molybdate transport system substrate-binding protein